MKKQVTNFKEFAKLSRDELDRLNHKIRRKLMASRHDTTLVIHSFIKFLSKTGNLPANSLYIMAIDTNKAMNIRRRSLYRGK